MEKKLCELFAGVGGFRVGLERADKNWETVFANQWEPGSKVQHAFDCYVRHFGKGPGIISNEDLNRVAFVPEHNLLVGGFPCQDYSVAATNAKGIHGKKGVLWWEIYRILKANDPEFILLENVDRLLKSPASQRGRDFGVILACLSSLGYLVQWRVINAADYGFVQRRRRVFIFAANKKTEYYKKHIKEAPIDILQTSGIFANEFPATIDESSIKETLFDIKDSEKDIKRISDTFQFPFEKSGVLLGKKVFTAKISPIEVKPKRLGEILEKNVAEKYYIDAKDFEKWVTMKGPKRIERTSKAGHSYVFTEGAIAHPDFLDRPARTMLTSEGKKNRSTHVIEDPQTKRLRLLTPAECEKIDGFKPGWTEGMPENFRYFCMGNALVVGVIEKLGIELNRIYAEEK